MDQGMKKKLTKIINKGRSVRPLRRKRGGMADIAIPRITNETLAVHREEVLKGARKYIYPLQHSKHKVVLVSSALAIAAVVTFVSYCLLSLYRFQTTSTFMYKVTQVIPFPIARSGSSFVSYENYLFELRHYMHYYESQQKLSFDTEAGQQQLNEFKQRTLERVIDDAYVKRLAKQNDVTVTDAEINAQIELLKGQNRLGSNEKVFEDVLNDFWGWSITDFRRSLKQQLLMQKLAAKLDTTTDPKARAALAEIRAGKDFAVAAREYSDDSATKDNGGDLGLPIEKNNRDIPPQTVDALFKLQPGEVSDVINIGYALQIVKNLEVQGERVRGAHIVFNFEDVTKRLNDEKDKQKTRVYIGLKPIKAPEDGGPVN
jgi:parvulin-like peptidyl-prolyl isomerase